MADHEVAHDVAEGVDRFGVGREVGIGQRRERLVVDRDRRAGPAGGLGVLRGDDRHRLAHEPDDAVGQHRLVAHLEAERVRPGQVGRGQDRVHARHRERGSDVDRPDAGVRVGRAQRVAPEHPLGDQVGPEGELPADLGDAVGSRCRLADARSPRSVGGRDPGRRTRGAER